MFIHFCTLFSKRLRFLEGGRFYAKLSAQAWHKKCVFQCSTDAIIQILFLQKIKCSYKHFLYLVQSFLWPVTIHSPPPSSCPTRDTVHQLNQPEPASSVIEPCSTKMYTCISHPRWLRLNLSPIVHKQTQPKRELVLW